MISYAGFVSCTMVLDPACVVYPDLLAHLFVCELKDLCLKTGVPVPQLELPEGGAAAASSK